MTFDQAYAKIEEIQELNRKFLHQDQDRVEGTSGDGLTPETPFIKANSDTLRIRHKWSETILNLELEKEYIKEIEYLINHDVFHEKVFYNLNHYCPNVS